MYNITPNTVIIQSILKEFMELKKDKSYYEQYLRDKIRLDETGILSGLLSVGTESRRIKFDIPMVKNNIKLTLNAALPDEFFVKKENYGEGTILLDPGSYRVILKGAEGGTGRITNGISNSTREKTAGGLYPSRTCKIKCVNGYTTGRSTYGVYERSIG
jgi:hypothetical protein